LAPIDPHFSSIFSVTFLFNLQRDDSDLKDINIHITTLLTTKPTIYIYTYVCTYMLILREVALNMTFAKTYVHARYICDAFESIYKKDIKNVDCNGESFLPKLYVDGAQSLKAR
jgi:hypothetical protein